MNFATPQENKPARNLIPIFISVFLVLVIAGIGTVLFILQKPKSKPKEEKPAFVDKSIPKNYVPTTEVEKKMAADIKQYGVVCRRFTSVEAALKEIPVACELDLSNQALAEIPSDVDKLTSLNSIDLSNNSLTVFPSNLLEIKTLLTLNLDNNNITSFPVPEPSVTPIPSIIPKAPALQSVSIKNNPLPQQTKDSLKQYFGKIITF